MKKMYFTILVLILVGIGSGAKAQLLEPHDNIVGINLKTQENIVATEYPIDGMCFGYAFTGDDYLLLQIAKVKKKKKLVPDFAAVYDLHTNQQKWIAPIDKGSRILLFDNHFYSKIKNSYNLLDNETGNVAKNLDKMSILSADFDNHLLFCLSQNSSTIIGYDSRTGEKLWESGIDPKFGISDIVKLDDSTYAIAANGITTVNSKDGSGWQYKTKTGKTNVGESVAVNTAGLLVGLLTGYGFYQSSPSHVKGIVSNVFGGSDGIYIAGRKELVKLDKNSGQLIWQIDLLVEYTSKSRIFETDSSIVLVNYGTALNDNNAVVQHGKPFIAAFSKNDGAFRYLKTFGDANKRIIHFYETNHYVNVLLTNDLVRLDLETGQNVDEIGLADAIEGQNILGILEKDNFYTKDTIGKFNLHCKDGDSFCVISSNHDTFVVDGNFNISFAATWADSWSVVYEDDICRVFTSVAGVEIADTCNNRVATLSIPLKFSVEDGNIVYYSDNSIFRIKLSDIMRAAQDGSKL